MGPIFSQLGNAAWQAVIQLAKSPGAKYFVVKTVKK